MVYTFERKCLAFLLFSFPIKVISHYYFTIYYLAWKEWKRQIIERICLFTSSLKYLEMIWNYSVPSLLCLSLCFPPTRSFTLKFYCSFLLKNIHICMLYYGMEILDPEKAFFLLFFSFTSCNWFSHKGI